MTNSFLAKFDAMAHRAFAPVGLSDRGSYRTKAGVVTPDIPVRIDRSVQAIGQDGITTTSRIEITLFRSHVPNPQVLATVTVNGETFQLNSKVEEAQDESQSRWVAVNA